jgi:hypothetical protein
MRKLAKLIKMFIQYLKFKKKIFICIKKELSFPKIHFGNSIKQSGQHRKCIKTRLVENSISNTDSSSNSTYTKELQNKTQKQ